MKKQPTNPTKAPRRPELDREPIADLEIDTTDGDAIRGGGRGGPITN